MGRARRFVSTVLFGAVGLLLVSIGTPTAQAATFVVEDGAAVGDNNPGDGECKSKFRPSTLAQRCTLQAAIEEANALPGAHTITFASTGTFRFSELFEQNVKVTGNVSIIGSGAANTELTAAGLLGRLAVAPGGTLRLHGVTYRNSGDLSNFGGTLLVTSSVIRETSGGSAIFHQREPLLVGFGPAPQADFTRITNSRITANVQPTALSPELPIILRFGNSTVSRMIIENSTIDNNVQKSATTPLGVVRNGGTLEFKNVTYSANRNENSSPGPSGFFVQDGGQLLLDNVTFTGNSQSVVAGSVATVIANNSIFANNGGRNCNSDTNIRGQSNIDDGNTCERPQFSASQNLLNTNPLLGALQSNGGPTQTHLLQTGSPAIDAGTCVLLTDQRGFTRPLDGDANGSLLCDIGSVEMPRLFRIIIPPLGVPGISPTNATIRPGETLTETFTWDVPAPTNWGALGTMDLRLRANGAIAFWVRWDQLQDTFQLIDAAGQPAGLAVPPGVDLPLSQNGVTLKLGQTTTQGSGVTGQRSTLALAFTFDSATVGTVYQVEVSAQDDEGRQDPYTTAGQIHVVAHTSATPPSVVLATPERDEREKEWKPRTDLEKRQVARTNQGGLEEERTEGNVLAVRCGQQEIEIGGVDGVVLLKLRGDSRGACAHVKPGDYVEADGQKEHEHLFWVDELSIDR